jgi:hypothetical protein
VSTDPWPRGEIDEGPPPQREDQPPARETQNPKETT